MATKSKKTTSKKKPAFKSSSNLSKRNLIVFGLMFAAIGTYFVLTSLAAAPSNFIKVATHPQASASNLQDGRAATDWHKTIASLRSWNGKLYGGYGDYNANTGPIAINPFDGTNFASNAATADIPYCAGAAGPQTPEVCKSQTEATWLWREIKGKLYAPSTDPTGGSQSDFAIGTSTGSTTASWLNPRYVGATHAYDMATLTGTDLWLVGSSGSNAAAWRSLDGGITWKLALSSPPLKADAFARFYGVGVFGGKLYVQGVDSNGSKHPKAKVFNPATNAWEDGPSIGTLTRSEEFAGKLVFSTGYHTGISYGALRAFDGTSTTSPGNLGMYDFTIDRTTKTIYVLGYDNSVKKSQDLINWQPVGTAPTVARSIAIFQGKVYLGGTDSGIYMHDGTGGGSIDNDTSDTDTIDPKVTISQPDEGSTVSSRTTIEATGSDNVKVTRMEIYIDGELVKSANTKRGSSLKYGWNTRSLPEGQHSINVKAYDDAGNIGQASVTVNK